MKMTEVHASFEKRISDGNYGGECATVNLIAQLEDGDTPMMVLETLQAEARGMVMRDLGRSSNANIRRQIAPPVRAAVQMQETELEELPDFEEVRR